MEGLQGAQAAPEILQGLVTHARCPVHGAQWDVHDWQLPALLHNQRVP